MIEHRLQGRRIAVIEDEYIQADELATELRNAGAVVLGPVGNVEDALALAEAEDHIDGALLDTNLHGEMVFAVADADAARRTLRFHHRL